MGGGLLPHTRSPHQGWSFARASAALDPSDRRGGRGGGV